MKALLSLAGVALASTLVYPAVDAAPTHDRAENPLGRLVRDAIDATPLHGQVEQRLDAGSYSYLAVRSDDRALHWVVTLGGGAPQGTRVEVRSLGHHPNFHSRRLKRTFADLTFGIVRTAP